MRWLAIAMWAAIAGLLGHSAAMAAVSPPPTGVHVSARTRAYVTVAWTRPTGVASFRVWRDDVGRGTTTATSFRFGPLHCGSRHTFEVAGLRAGDTASPRVTVRGSTLACPLAVITRPAISGTAAPGGSLQVSDGIWSAPATFAYRWARCVTTSGPCSAIPRATAASYTVTPQDAVLAVRAAVTATATTGTVTASAPAIAVPGATPAPACTAFADPAGSDAADGTAGHPFRTAQRLVDSLTPGGVGCLGPGTYAEDVTVHAAGTPADPVTVTSRDPAQPATLRGRLYVHAGADWVTFSHLAIDGRNAANLPSPTVNASHVTFAYDDVTNHNDPTAGGNIAFLVGSAQYGRADFFTADHDVVHNVGDLATAADHTRSWGGFYEHAFYLQATTGWRITNCIMYAVSGRGIQLYTDAQDGYAANNLIDDAGTGEIIDGHSSGNVFTRNIVTRASVLGGVARGSSFTGTGNVVADNVFWGNRVDLSGIPAAGIAASGNVAADPGFLDPAAHDYRLPFGSPAAGYGPDTIQP